MDVELALLGPSKGRGWAVLVTGSRNWDAIGTVGHVLGEYELRDLVAIVVGDCPTGADAAARAWARDWDVPLVVVRADWAALGSRAGPIRNGKLVDVLNDFRRRGVSTRCESFPLSVSRGTRDCMAQAARAGHEVRVWNERGKLVDEYAGHTVSVSVSASATVSQKGGSR